MMAPSERLALLGLIFLLEPKQVLELGCGDGGLTRWLARLVPQVTTVDLDPDVNRTCKSLGNVSGLCMTTEEALKQFANQGRRFDLVIIDAEHSTHGAKTDLEGALCLSDVILMHDTFRPACRIGLQRALADKDVYANLDLVEGGLQPDGLWGGLGIVVTWLPSTSRTFVTQRHSVYPRLRRLYHRQLWRRQILQFPASMRYRVGTWLRRNSD